MKDTMIFDNVFEYFLLFYLTRVYVVRTFDPRYL